MNIFNLFKRKVDEKVTLDDILIDVNTGEEFEISFTFCYDYLFHPVGECYIGVGVKYNTGPGEQEYSATWRDSKLSLKRICDQMDRDLIIKDRNK